MKKFFKIGATFAAVVLALTCLAGCEHIINDSSVELSGGINGYYIQTIRDNAYHTKGY